MADEAFLGRRLLSLRGRLQQMQPNGSEKKLRRKLIRVLLQLNNTADAEAEARIMMSKWPSWPAARSIAADVKCRRGNWSEAEALFKEARDLYISLQDMAGADRLETGPLYRLAEARGDQEACISLAEGEQALKQVLAARARRRSGEIAPVPAPSEEDSLAAKLRVLEEGWADSAPMEELLKTAITWGDSEPEWRWRMVVEGIELWKYHSLRTKPWWGILKATSCPVLDPRWSKEWRKLNHDRKE